MPRKDSLVNASNAQAQQDTAAMGIEAYELPKSVVTKLARSALPDNAKMQKEMLLAVLKGSTVFVNYLAANSHEVANSRQHKSVSASDVLRALEQMEMGDVVPRLTAELDAYRNNQKAEKPKKGGARGRAKDPDPASAPKSKGKEKAAGPTITIPGRTSASVQPKARDATTTNDPESEDEDAAREDEDEEMADADQDVLEEGEEDVAEDDEIDEEEVEGEGEGEGEDVMTVEDEELQKDARGVEERDQDDDD